MKLSSKQSIGIVACSNGIHPTQKEQLETLDAILTSFGLTPIWSPYIYQQNGVFSGSAKERAKALMAFYLDENIQAIFDISGGDLANSVLDYLDFDIICQHPKPFFGYSDLTTLLNAIYTQVSQPTYLYQLRNLINADKEMQQFAFNDTLLGHGTHLFDIHWQFIQGNSMHGTVIGGNIRCFLKLAGTSYLPDFTNKLLFLESYGGGIAQITTYLTQLKQLGAFDKIAGLLLGTFTQMESELSQSDCIALVKAIVDRPALPMAKTSEVGHGADSKCLVIGSTYAL